MSIRVKPLTLFLLALVALPLHESEGSAQSAQVSQAIAQAVIDHPNLTPYLHPETPGRVPMVVSEHLLEPGVRLSKFGNRVLIEPDSKLTTGAFLRFDDVFVTADVMIIRVSYPIEGVSGRFVLTSDPAGHWAVRVADIWEK